MFLKRRVIQIGKKFLFFPNFFIDCFLLGHQLLKKREAVSTLLCISFPASIGGTELLINRLAERSDKKVAVLTVGRIGSFGKNEFIRRLKEKGIPHVHLGYLGLAKSGWYLVPFIKKFGASHCHIFNPRCSPIILAMKQAGLTVVYFETVINSRDGWGAPLIPYINAIDSVIAVSKASLQKFREEFSFNGPSQIVYSLIDPPNPALRSREPKEGELKILYFGRLHALKGVGQLLCAFRKFLPSFPSARLTFLGDGPEKQPLQHSVKKWRLEESVDFIPFQTQEELYLIMATYDLFCLPSFTDGAPCCILESMAIGLAVIGTNVGGIPELIEDGKSGIVIPPGDEAALVRALQLLAFDPALRREIGSNGLKRYQAEFHVQ